MPLQPRTDLEILPDPASNAEYTIKLECPEFTCLCPQTGQPDFGTVYIEYIPKEHIVELKSLKQYLWSWRDRRAFHESVTNEIFDTLDEALTPEYMQIRVVFNVRGGITTEIVRTAWS